MPQVGGTDGGAEGRANLRTGSDDYGEKRKVANRRRERGSNAESATLKMRAFLIWDCLACSQVNMQIMVGGPFHHGDFKVSNLGNGWKDGWTWLRPNNSGEGKAGKRGGGAEEEAFRNTFSLRDITSAAARERRMPREGKRGEREHSAPKE